MNARSVSFWKREEKRDQKGKTAFHRLFQRGAEILFSCRAAAGNIHRRRANGLNGITGRHYYYWRGKKRSGAVIFVEKCVYGIRDSSFGKVFRVCADEWRWKC